jgi:hypothetical protein
MTVLGPAPQRPRAPAATAIAACLARPKRTSDLSTPIARFAPAIRGAVSRVCQRSVGVPERAR